MRGGKPEIWLWGACDGKRVLLIEGNFKPYFYLVISGSAEDVLPALRGVSLEIEEPIELQLSEKKIYGETVKAVKVICLNPEAVVGIAKRLSKVEGGRGIL